MGFPLKKKSYFHTRRNIKQMPGFVCLINFVDVWFRVCVLETSRVNPYMNNKQPSRVSPSFNTTSDIFIPEKKKKKKKKRRRKKQSDIKQ